jgi:hypothetical protein
MAFDLRYPHTLEPADAQARLHALGEYLANKYGLSVSWTDDETARIIGKYLVVAIDGTLVLEPGEARFSGKDPGLLWRGKARDYLLGKLKKYLDPGTPLTALPRR